MQSIQPACFRFATLVAATTLLGACTDSYIKDPNWTHQTNEKMYSAEHTDAVPNSPKTTKR